jgi:hypothetical protein
MTCSAMHMHSQTRHFLSHNSSSSSSSSKDTVRRQEMSLVLASYAVAGKRSPSH